MRTPRRPDPAPEGAPLWMVTYGDMMGLLLCFFVLIVSLSQIKVERFRQVMESMRRAFGGTPATGGDGGEGGTGGTTGESQGNSPYDRLSYFEFARGVPRGRSQSEVAGQTGPYGRVTAVREGDRSVVGGRIGFARGSAELSDEARQRLPQIVELLRGHPNKIEVRGHDSREPLPSPSPYRDRWDLAFARARTVADFLLAHDIPAERVRLVSCADGEPLPETYQTDQAWRNRRVEVILMEATAEEFTGQGRTGPVGSTGGRVN